LCFGFVEIGRMATATEGEEKEEEEGEKSYKSTGRKEGWRGEIG
jgi:hypothetical protein